MPGSHSFSENSSTGNRVFSTLWALIFAIPFSAVALLMTWVSIRALWRREWLPAVIGVSFALAFGGVSIMLWESIFSLWQRPAHDVLVGPIECGSRTELRQFWLLSIICTGVGALFMAGTVLIWREGNRLWIPLLLLMPATAGFVIVTAVRKNRAWRQFGPSRLHGSPAFLGGRVTGVIALGRGMRTGQPVQLRWLCKEERRSGRASIRLVTILEGPASECVVQSAHGQFEIPFALAVPSDAPPTGEKHHWFLRANASTSPAKYEAEFVVPIGELNGGTVSVERVL